MLLNMCGHFPNGIGHAAGPRLYLVRTGLVLVHVRQSNIRHSGHLGVVRRLLVESSPAKGRPLQPASGKWGPSGGDNK